MHIITGGTGQVGSALAKALLQMGEPVTIVSRNAKAASAWQHKGAAFAVADIHNTRSLHAIFKKAKSVFILNPPADPMTNTSAEERKTADSLVAALNGLDVERVVVASTLGARPGENIGDLGVLYALEQGIGRLPYPYSIIRSGYYMSNWAQSLEAVKASGELTSFLPAGLKIPMVAPKDIGELAARLMTEKDPPEHVSIQGPELYSPEDVATAFARALSKTVSVKVIPRDALISTFKSFGFSDEAATSYARMTEITIDDPDIPVNPVRGATSLQEYIEGLLR